MGDIRRHPAEVTADRLADALDRWPERFDGRQRDAIGELRTVLEQIADDAGPHQAARSGLKHEPEPMPTPPGAEEKITDLMAALEASVREAKAERKLVLARRAAGVEDDGCG